MTDEPTHERIEEQAARWTSRLDGGELSPADRLALHAWLDEAPGHRAAFEQYQLICDDTAAALPLLAQVSPVARPAAAPPRRRARWIAVAAGLAAVLALCVIWLVPYYRDTRNIATMAAQRSTLSLPDGSHADLNAQTALFTDFRGGARFVRLRKGEAFFSVAKDPAHPFLVETPAGTVRVTGTHFNVRLTPDSRVEVTLLEGSVEIQNSLARLALRPGQQLSAAGELRALSPRELECVTAWREGRIVLNGLTLAEAAARYAAYHGNAIAVAPELAATQLGGSFELDNLQGFFDALADDTLGLRVIRRAPGNYAIVRR